MPEHSSPSIAARIVGTLVGVFGLAALLVPLQHAGPYGVPGRGIVGGVLGLVIAGVLLTRTATPLRIAAWAATLPVLFFAVYASFAEMEEVVVLYAEAADLRLWIVDHEGVEWVSMPRAKAEENALDGARLQLLRAGTTRCVIPRLVDDEAAKRRTVDLRQEKYAVQRMAVAVGLFGREPGPENVTLRLDPCG